MRIISRTTLVNFSRVHAKAKTGLERWYSLASKADWKSMDELQRTFPKAKILNRERARFEIAGGNYRLIVAFDFPRQVAYVKFAGTHAEYDNVDALKVSQF